MRPRREAPQRASQRTSPQESDRQDWKEVPASPARASRSSNPALVPPTESALPTGQLGQLLRHVKDLADAVKEVLPTISRQAAPPLQEVRRSRSRSRGRSRPPYSRLERRFRSPTPHSSRNSTPGRGIPDHLPRNTALEAKLEEMNQQIEALKRRDQENRGEFGFNINPPFSQKIMNEPVPPRFKMPQLETYDGSADPLDHLEMFKAVMLLHGATDGVLCRAFPATLKGAARFWYSGLRPGTIHSFEQLGQVFSAHFVTSRRCRRGSDSLINVRQREDEPLRDYVRRFNAAALEVRHLDQASAMMALKGGLQRCRFLFSLEKRYPENFAEMLKRAESYANAEEAMDARDTRAVQDRRDRRSLSPWRQPSKHPHQQSPKSSRRSRSPRRGPLVPRRSRTPPQKGRSSLQRFNNYTPLNKPRAEVLMEISDKEYLRAPKKMRGPPHKRDLKKYCRFHRDHGHDTEECIQLRDEIEALIRRGRLNKYVSGSKRSDELPAEVPASEAREQAQPVAGIINVLVGGSPSTGIRRPREEGAGGDVIPAAKKKSGEVISFSDDDLRNVQGPHDDAMVVSLEIANYDVRRVLVDNGSSADVLFYDAFCRMKLPSSQLGKINTPLVGFSGDPVPVEGVISLPVKAGQEPKRSTVQLRFLVVKVPSAYNAILGRPGLNALRAIVSTFHLLMRFPTDHGVGEVRGDQMMARQCYMASLKGKRPMESLPIEGLDTRDELKEQRGSPADELESIPLIDGQEDKTVQIGSTLKGKLREQLIDFLRTNIDVFAWSSSDMIGISPEVIIHKLNTDNLHRPIRQKKRTFAPERQQAIDGEIDNLLKVGFIREVSYPEWLANVVLVKKSNGKWRVCIDYTDLNKACPKDSFPLPRIDQLVDATSGHKLLSFMDAFSGYNQIRMAPEDEEKTSFTTDKGLYCYKVMPFGLKNAGATYQRLVNKIFKEQIGRNMEVYVDDMLVKSKEQELHIADLKESFGILRKYQMKLNPSKCAFGVESGKFLGFMVSQRGIEVNPEKIRAIQEMVSPASVKEVQKLTGRVAALSRFISRSAERCLPFFKVLRKSGQFLWSEECQSAFEDLKNYLGTAPLLSKPSSGQTLFLYLAVSFNALSSVLIHEEGSLQRPVYYVSHVLRDAETRYTRLEKMIFTLVISARKLPPYFQAIQ